MFKLFALLFCFHLFWLAECSEDDEVAALLARGSVNEQVTIDASLVDENSKRVLADAGSNSSRSLQRLKRQQRKFARSNSNVLVCNLTKHEGIYFYGTLITVSGNIDNADLCGSVCWKFGRRCQSVNYITTTRTCELMQNQLNVQNTNMLRFNAQRKYDSVYIIPQSCTENEPVQQQEPPPPPPKSPSLTPPKAGSCGQTAVAPRISRGAITQGTGRIIGGTEARPHSLPWQVSLRQGRTIKFHFCGGALIRVNENREQSDIVVTAAHCMAEKPVNLQVVAGGHNVFRPADGEQRVSASKHVMHDYNETTLINDIAVIKLAEPINFTATAQPACLPSPGELVPDNTMGIVSGWGHLSEGSHPSAKLMQLLVPTVSSHQCNSSFMKSEDPTEVVPELMLCAGYLEGGRDACQGDSGGPLAIPSTRGFVLQGVVSFGEGCARPGFVGAYARVSSYVDWIQQKIKELSELQT